MSSGVAVATSAAIASPPILASYNVLKLGRTGAAKRRVLVVRSDVLTFVEAPPVSTSTSTSFSLQTALIKRLIPFPCIHSMTSYEGGRQLHLLIRNQHDIFFWKEGDGDHPPVDDVANLILKLSRQCGNPINFVRESGPVDPDDMSLDKHKLALPYNSMARRCELRRSKTKVAVPPGPISLQSWDAIGSPLPFALDGQKMSSALQRTLGGSHVVMLGAVLVHEPTHLLGPGGLPVSRVLAFTPSRFIVCEEDSGKELVSCCLFSLHKITLDSARRSVTLSVSDEIISRLTFSFPQQVKNEGAHVSDDIGVVSNVIRFLLAREGSDVLLFRDDANNSSSIGGGVGGVVGTPKERPSTQPPSSAPSPPSFADTSAVTPTSTSAAAVTTDKAPIRQQTALATARPAAPLSPLRSSNTSNAHSSALALIPDYKKPHGPIASKFKSPHVVMSRQVVRLTSKGAWEPRIWVVTTQERLLVCDEKMNVKRSVHLDHIEDICTIIHWEGEALAIKIQGEHDLVVKLHPDCPKDFTIGHMVSVLASELHSNPSFHEVVPRKDAMETKERLRDVLLRERPMKKGTTFMSPAQEAARQRSASVSRHSTMNNTTTSNVSMTSAETSPPHDAGSTRAPSQADMGSTQRTTDVSSPNAVSTSAGSPTHEQQRRVALQSEDAAEAAASEGMKRRRLQAALAVVIDDEEMQRERLIAAERQGGISVLAELADDERRCRNAERRRLDQFAAAQRAEEESRQRERDAVEFEVAARRLQRETREAEEVSRRQRETEEAMLRTAKLMLLEMEAKYRVDIEAMASDSWQRSLREESLARQVIASRDTLRRMHSTVPSALRSERSVVSVSSSEHTEAQGAVMAVDRAIADLNEGAETAPPSPLSDNEDVAVWAAPGTVGRTPSTSASLVPAAAADTPHPITPPPSLPPPTQRNSFSQNSVVVRKEISLFASPVTPQSLSMVSHASVTTPPATQRFLAASASNRVITFPTPTSQGVPARGSDGSKNCFFRIKIGSSDAIAVVGNEKFAATLLEQLRSSDKSALGSAAGASTASFMNERVVCVSTDEPCVGSGVLRTLVDVLRTSSLRSWIRRDMTTIRSSNFLWVEMGVIPFVVALERGEKTSAIADKLLAGGAAAHNAPTKQ